MRKRILQTTLISAISLFVVSVLAFAIGEMIPGSHYTGLELYTGDPQDRIAEMQRRRAYLESPVHVRYWRWLTSLGGSSTYTYSGGTYRAGDSQQAASGTSPKKTSQAPAAGPSVSPV